MLRVKRRHSGRENEHQLAKPIAFEYAHNALGPLKPSIVPWMETRRGKGMGRTAGLENVEGLFSSQIASLFHRARSQG